MNVRLSALALLLSATVLLPAQTIQVNRDNRTIAITASEDAEALADTAVVTVGFTGYGATQDATYADASRISNAIMDALTRSGIKPDDIHSASQSLEPLAVNADEDKLRFSRGSRFIFRQSWTVTVPAKSAADTLHLAITAGANTSGNIEWRLAQEDALEAEAAQKALTHARAIADRMAKGLNARLGPLIYASNQTPPRVFGAVMQTESASLAMRKENLKPLAISPEKISKSATVYAVFSIE